MNVWRLMATLVLGCMVAACQPAQRADERQDRVDHQVQNAPALPLAEPPLDRRALLFALADAASAAALGENDRERQRAFDGKRFEMRLRFGCGGAASLDSTEPRRWNFDEDSRVLRFHVKPEVNLETPLVKSIAATGFEAVEGFWVRMPWLLSAGCPPARTMAMSEPSPAPQQAAEPLRASNPVGTDPRIAIVQFYTAADPRTHRRDSRAYQATRTLAADEAPSVAGFNLVLSGRLKALPGGRVITCAVAAADEPPACVISAVFDQVAIEVPDNNEIVAQWTTG